MDWFPVLIAAVTSLLGSDDLRWAGVLGGLDDVRARAFAHADPQLLDQVYASTSTGRADDAAIIRDYASRGARVLGADLVLVSCRVRSLTPQRVSLDVVDRLGAARVAWADGTIRELPRDRPTRRVVTLVRTPAGWRIG